MTFAVKVDGITKEWGGKRLFDSVCFDIELGEKVVLFGRNGVGKTTLISALMGRTAVDEGSIHHFVPLTEWGWLEQELFVPEGMTLVEFVRSGNSDLQEQLERVRRLEKQMSEVTAQAGFDGSGAAESNGAVDELERILNEYAEAEQAYLLAGGYEFETEVEASLTRLQLPRQTWETAFADLSGGQKTRAQLARLMVRHPKVLLLDEPTNHLDSETLNWLESYIKSYDGTVLMVTHDRAFMNHVADAIIELTANGAKRYSGGYDVFRAQKELEIRTQQALYEKQERERQHLLEAIQRYQQWYDRAHHAAGERNPFLKKRAMKNSSRFRAKEQALVRLESQRVEQPREAPHARIEFDEGTFEARVFVETRDMTVAFGKNVVLSKVNLTVERGMRIAVTGRNGCGKTTLLRAITAQIDPTQGDVRHHPALRVGYFDQELQRLNLDQTVLDSLLYLPRMTESEARTILAGFLFRKEDVFKRIGDLSMGERCRVAFVQLYFSEANLLVLDEPTNYLDVDTRERVEEALLSYPGALIVVSHDRYLLKKIANRIVTIEGGLVSVFDGGLDDYEARLARPQYRDLSVENEIYQLELLLTQWMGEEEPSDELARQELVQRIKGAQQKLNTLKQSARYNEEPDT